MIIDVGWLCNKPIVFPNSVNWTKIGWGKFCNGLPISLST